MLQTVILDDASESAPHNLHTHNEVGMTTAEYTVGTLGACSIAAILIKLAQTPWFGDLVKGLLGNIAGIAGF
jgi:hypothetical protein